jgi:hypothetical protein
MISRDVTFESYNRQQTGQDERARVRQEELRERRAHAEEGGGTNST